MGRDVIDSDGKSIGNLETFFADRNTGRPEWLGVFTGTFLQHHYLVPVEGAVGRGQCRPYSVDEGPGKERSRVQRPRDRASRRTWSARPTAHYGLQPAVST